ncbi:hypothetical protein [Paraburkholderia elongata]|uniref:hypothetical protein n=1 Tax=Paraburkholderia elongata TaxID=2675747 RepID=UPI001F43CD2D|nr:hypothetical protein [Paraburkholderia elongata]
MRKLTPAGQQLIEEVAQRHGFSTDAVMSMLESVIQSQSQGTQQQGNDGGGQQQQQSAGYGGSNQQETAAGPVGPVSLFVPPAPGASGAWRSK